MTTASNHSQGVSVQVHGLRRSYGEEEVLKGLDFEVAAG